MNTLDIRDHRVLSITAHPDDLEMLNAGLLTQADEAYSLVATDGGASTVDYDRGSLC